MQGYALLASPHPLVVSRRAGDAPRTLAEAQRFRTAGPGLVPEQAAARAQALSCEGPAVNARSPRYSRGRCGAREARRERGHGGRAGQRGSASHGWRRRGRGGGEQRRRRRSCPCGRLFGTTSASIDGCGWRRRRWRRSGRRGRRHWSGRRQLRWHRYRWRSRWRPVGRGGGRRFGPRRGWRWLRRQPSRRAQQRGGGGSAMTGGSGGSSIGPGGNSNNAAGGGGGRPLGSLARPAGLAHRAVCP